jgi:hypothetical protein
MPLQSGDIRFARSAVMADVDNGGGPPTAQLIPDGASNALFPDISEDARTGGLVEVRQVHAVLRNTDTDALLGANVIVAEPPDDDNVSITLIKSPGTFSRRPDLVKLIEATSTPGSEFNGYLLENHVEGQRSLQIAQRPGITSPGVNTSLVLVQDEGLVTEYSQYVRVRRVTVTEEIRTTTDGSGNPVDFIVQIASCELFSPLLHDFPGSAANRFHARTAGKTKTRAVNVTDAGTFYSASRLTDAVLATDQELFLDTVYTQIVPNTRTETPLLNQRPGGLRTVDLVDAYGTLQVSAATHSERIYIEEANQGFSHVFKLIPPPAPNSVAVSGVFLGNWGTVVDDGVGGLGDGPGSGTVLYSTGDMATTFDAMPDYNTFLIATWADTSPFVNACAAGQIVLNQAPEFELDITAGSNLNGATITWPSGGSTRTATVSAAGVISGDATGLAIGALGKVWIKPTFMPDAGANFSLDYDSRPTVIESLSGVTVDSGGYAALAFAQEPIPETLKVRWTTARKVSKSSGSDQSGTGIRTVTSGSTTKSAFTKTSESASADTVVVVNTINDDGAGGWGNPALGTVNYAGQSASLRLVDQGASTTAYRSDQEKAVRFYEVGGSIISMG